VAIKASWFCTDQFGDKLHKKDYYVKQCSVALTHYEKRADGGARCSLFLGAVYTIRHHVITIRELEHRMTRLLVRHGLCDSAQLAGTLPVGLGALQVMHGTLRSLLS
jgi:hypothetical protein